MGLLKDDELVDIDILDVGFVAVSPSIGSEITLEVSNGCIPETPCGMSPNVKLSLLSVFSLMLLKVVSVSVYVISPITVSQVVFVQYFPPVLWLVPSAVLHLLV